MTLYHAPHSWQRTGPQRPCPICGHKGWCSVAASGEFAICMRECAGALRRTRNGGYLHRLGCRSVRKPIARGVEIRESRHDMRSFAQQCHLDIGAISDLSRSLGLGTLSLHDLLAGWSRNHRAWTFPMRDADGRVIGIRLRRPDGQKSSVRGGREGLFLSIRVRRMLSTAGDVAHPDPLFVCEGPTDTAALLDLDLSAIGRPSCTGGVRVLQELVARLNPGSVVIVADADGPGMRGGTDISIALAPYCRDVRLIVPPPPFKDARAWRQSGATATEVLQQIEGARPVRLVVATTPFRKPVRHGE